jgi:hypothetical protein
VVGEGELGETLAFIDYTVERLTRGAQKKHGDLNAGEGTTSPRRLRSATLPSRGG